jgi:rhodanese-related sulfurtransferase
MPVETRLPLDVFRLRQEGRTLHLIDVRTPAEFSTIHAEGAQLIPLAALDPLDPKQIMCALDGSPDEPLYVICQSGGRAAKAVERFHSAGFHNVFSVAGGTTAWEPAGLPVVRGNRKRQVRIAAGALVLREDLSSSVLGHHRECRFRCQQ